MQSPINSFLHFAHHVTADQSPRLRQAAYHTYAALPKFTIANHSALPPLDQALAAQTPPLPYPDLLLGTEASLRVGDQLQPTPAQIVLRLTDESHSLVLVEGMISLPNSCEWLILPGTMTMTTPESPTSTLDLVQITIDTSASNPRHQSIHEALTLLGTPQPQHLLTTLCALAESVYSEMGEIILQFLALLSAENVEIIPPAPTLSLRRERSRLRSGKRVDQFATHHLRITGRRTERQSTPPGPQTPTTPRRPHWRRAHLRHYTAGRGHIRKTKTIAIAPCFITGSAPGTVEKDYII